MTVPAVGSNLTAQPPIAAEQARCKCTAVALAIIAVVAITSAAALITLGAISSSADFYLIGGGAALALAGVAIAARAYVVSKNPAPVPAAEPEVEDQVVSIAEEVAESELTAEQQVAAFDDGAYTLYLSSWNDYPEFHQALKADARFARFLHMLPEQTLTNDELRGYLTELDDSTFKSFLDQTTPQDSRLSIAAEDARFVNYLKAANNQKLTDLKDHITVPQLRELILSHSPRQEFLQSYDSVHLFGLLNGQESALNPNIAYIIAGYIQHLAERPGLSPSQNILGAYVRLAPFYATYGSHFGEYAESYGIYATFEEASFDWMNPKNKQWLIAEGYYKVPCVAQTVADRLVTWDKNIDLKELEHTDFMNAVMIHADDNQFKRLAALVERSLGATRKYTSRLPGRKWDMEHLRPWLNGVEADLSDTRKSFLKDTLKIKS
jgi:hypothetical protein